MELRSMTVTIFLVLCCIQVAGAFTYDGRPRPKGFADIPTTAYGKLPTVYNKAGLAVDCDWYGWAHVGYPATITNQCLAYNWKTKILDEAGQYTLIPYRYYRCFVRGICSSGLLGDPGVLCKIGCFYLSNSTTALPPISSSPPPAPPAAITPPADTATPPPPGLKTPPGAPVPPSGSQSPAPPGPPTTITNVNSDGGESQRATAVLLCCAVAGAAALIHNQLAAR